MPTLKVFPQRYEIKTTPEGRALVCLEAPNIVLRVQSGLTVSESAARKSPSGTIFLDGVANCGPFLDNEKRVYNFDHHEGCVRPFTLSSCEQALIMVFKGLDLRNQDWTVWINDPDLDAVLAAWLLCNHVRLKQKEPASLQPLIALVRLEGLIDANGLEFTAMSGFAQPLIDRTRQMIDDLRADELTIKKQGRWGKIDFLEYVTGLFHQIDSLVYKAEEFGDFKEVSELARLTLADDRTAVVVHADMGIYEIEPYLRRLYGDRLGLAALKTGANSYTLRLMDAFMADNLNPVYRQLNDEDPLVRRRSDATGWGGSADIGGSPRGIGTGLTPEKILAACADAFTRPTIGGHLKRLLLACVSCGLLVALAEVCRAHLFAHPWFGAVVQRWSWLTTDLGFWVALTFFATLWLVIFSRGNSWRYGLGLPCSWRWAAVAPAMVLAAIAGGVHLPAQAWSPAVAGGHLVWHLIVVALCCEVVWRGLVHGLLVFRTAVQTCRSKWFFTYPNVAAAVLYSFFITYFYFPSGIPDGRDQLVAGLETAFAALAFGLAAGFVRERSMSLVPGVVFHIVSMALIAAIGFVV